MPVAYSHSRQRPIGPRESIFAHTEHTSERELDAPEETGYGRRGKIFADANGDEIEMAIRTVSGLEKDPQSGSASQDTVPAIPSSLHKSLDLGNR